MTGRPLDIEGLTIVDDPNIQDGENGRSVEETA
jgi:small subunit ribosomal protein S16